jgi:exoribonuclease-2
MLPNDLHQYAVQTLRERGLEPDFTVQALAEAEAARNAPQKPGEGIRDLRHLPWFSIDNDDTRDLDQLSVVQPGGAGATTLLVAIADVDAMVRPDGAVDEHARANTTSVYTAAGVFPMLPEVLSTDVTSLHEGRDRLAIVVEMQVDGEGAVTQADVYRALVLNHAKLTYNAVSAWLDGTGPALPHHAAVAGQGTPQPPH